MIFEIIVFLGILTFLVFIHELGHFYSAKKFGIKVEEFGLGLPPKAISKKIGDTIYSLNWLPLGGFVQIKGEDLSEEVDLNDQTNFANKAPWQRIIVLLAGVFMNFVFAIGVFYISLWVNNWQSMPMISFSDHNFRFGETIEFSNVVLAVSENSAAQKAGVELGDRILSFEYGDEVVKAKDVAEVKAFLADKEGKEIKLNTANMATGEENTRIFIPEYSESIGQPALGVSLDKAIAVSYEKSKAFAGFYHVVNLTDYNIRILSKLTGISIQEKTIEPIAQSVSGPVGIFDVVKTILNTQSKNPLLAILDISAIISLSLAIMNLLPVPALDGGRVVFVLIEWISGKKLKPVWEATAHHYGFMFLIGLIVVITFKDIWMLVLR